jgi:hypothetical protein
VNTRPTVFGRPAIVVQVYLSSQRVADTVLVLASGTLRVPWATEVEIDPALETHPDER